MPNRLVWTPETKASAQALLDAGLDDHRVAAEIGMRWKAVCNAVTRGILRRPKQKPGVKRKVIVEKLILACQPDAGPGPTRGVGDMPGFDDY